MMLRLPSNVIAYATSVRGTDTERAVTLLPPEIHAMFAHPSRRICLQALHGLAECHISWQHQQQVRVICSPAHFQHAHFLRNAVSPIFCAENTMNQDIWIGMRHRPRPYGTETSVIGSFSQHLRAG